MRQLTNRVPSDLFCRLMLSRLTSAAALVIAGLLCCSLLPTASAASGQSLSQPKPRGPLIPEAFKVDLRKGWVMYVMPNRQWQVVDIEFVRSGKGKFSVSKGVFYSVGSHSGSGSNEPWPDLSAKVEPGEVSAHFGPVGAIDMHFVPVGGSRRHQPSCGGAGVMFARGYFEGSVRFSGGHGYPSVEAAKAQAAPRLELQPKCTGGWVAEGPSTLPGAELVANSIQSDTPSFEAFKQTPDARASIVAGISESGHGVILIRFVHISAPAATFQYSRSLERASVRLPAPFSGAGFFNADRDRRHRWSGSLAVDFPGRADVNLTHPPLTGFINPARWVPPRPTKFELGRRKRSNSSVFLANGH